MADLTLNGILENDGKKYYHICFYTDKYGPEPDNEDNYIFVPKQVCRIVDETTVSIQDWYVTKKKMDRFVRKSSRTMQGNARVKQSTPTPPYPKPIGAFRPKKL